MSDIKVNVNFNYPPAAHEECKAVLEQLGFRSFSIQPKRGSHTAEIYFFDGEEQKFMNELYNKTIETQRRRMFFSKAHPYGLTPYYYVNYLKK